MMGVEYGYKFVDETAEATVKRLITPHQINKIKLNPSRSNFAIIGKRSEIFNWLGNHGHLEVEYDQEFNFDSMGNPLTIPLLLCELYIEDSDDDNVHDNVHNNNHNNMFHKIFNKNKVHINPSTRMRLEIRPYHSQLAFLNNQQQKDNLVERKKATNGITLLQLLKAWTENDCCDRSTSDYE
ncbi:hypothetical protein Glove_134g51 [Diversispora epigaea]|uniref:Uncharacterized protein n=1 Tax=Diversispora epigaea TaxID=1348612 RepID=A0A397IX01_9GLOM|nr:hypothetical protein Glove_134g51 [Diversispora epigaea]